MFPQHIWRWSFGLLNFWKFVSPTLEIFWINNPGHTAHSVSVSGGTSRVSARRQFPQQLERDGDQVGAGVVQHRTARLLRSTFDDDDGAKITSNRLQQLDTVTRSYQTNGNGLGFENACLRAIFGARRPKIQCWNRSLVAQYWLN